MTCHSYVSFICLIKCWSSLDMTVLKSSLFSVKVNWKLLYTVNAFSSIVWRNSAVCYSLFWFASLVTIFYLFHICFQLLSSEAFVFMSSLPGGNNIFDWNPSATFTHVVTAHHVVVTLNAGQYWNSLHGLLSLFISVLICRVVRCDLLLHCHVTFCHGKTGQTEV